MQLQPKEREENLEQTFLKLEVLKPLPECTYLYPQAAEQDLLSKKSCSSPENTTLLACLAEDTHLGLRSYTDLLTRLQLELMSLTCSCS